MKRVVIHRPGGYNRLKIETAPGLVSEPGCVVVDVEAIGVNFADCIVRMGYYSSARKSGYPITPGFEFAGSVSQVGEGVTGFQAGDRVFGVTLFNAYATQASVSAHQLFLLPAKLSTIEAATFSVAFFTAWYAAIKLGEIQKGMTVLVHSAAGGAGGALAQICAAQGCRVIGVVGAAAKKKTALQMGCQAVIDKSSESLGEKTRENAPDGYDVIFDSTGGATLADSYQQVAPAGRLITFGFHSLFTRTGRRNFFSLAWNFFRTPKFSPIGMADRNRSVMAFNLSYLFGQKRLLAEGMRQLLDWLNAGVIRPLPVHTFAFEDVAHAQQVLESGQTTGKLALKVI